MGVAEDGGPPRSHVVDVALAVDIPQVRAVAARDEARRAADGAKGAHRRIDARRNRALRTGEELFVAVHRRFASEVAQFGKNGRLVERRRDGARRGSDVRRVEHGGDHGGRVRARAAEIADVARIDPADGHDAARRARRRVGGAPMSARTASGLTLEGKKLPNAT